MRATIKLKLWGTFGLLLIILTATILVGISRLTTLNDAIGEIVTGPAKQPDRARAIVSGVSLMVRSDKNLGLTEDPAERLLAFLRVFEDTADELMSAQSSCLYVAILTERQLVDSGTSEEITRAVLAWRREVAVLFEAALTERDPGHDLDCDALADHVFVTFEGAFILCRTRRDPGHMRRQLTALRRLVEGLLG